MDYKVYPFFWIEGSIGHFYFYLVFGIVSFVMSILQELGGREVYTHLSIKTELSLLPQLPPKKRAEGRNVITLAE